METLLPLRRGLGPLTAALALLTCWALWSSSLLSAPIAVSFVVSAFLWNQSRFELPNHAGTADTACAGCTAGCTGCRERIEAPDTA